ncbi:MAG: molybdopterin molybdotransferase MoeA [Terriglobales bacterium]
MSVVTFAEARRIVEQHARRLQPSAAESVCLLEARGRVLAEAVVADRDFPPFARATRDGYAVRAADVARVPVRLEVAGEVKAGISPERIAYGLEPGEAAEIMTGAPLPRGGDAVVMVEYTSRHNDVVEVRQGVAAGENVVRQGAEARAGDTLLAPGLAIDFTAVALAAAVGKAQLRVYAKPRVAILSTGDELVDVAAAPGPTQIRNSNSYSLAAQVTAAGARALILPIGRDDADELQRPISKGLTADLLLLTGGVSVGKYDVVERVLEEMGAEFLFTGALIQPGKPVVFGRLTNARSLDSRQWQAPARDDNPEGVRGSTNAEGAANKSRNAKGAEEAKDAEEALGRYFFGLPGNPVSTMVTFEVFVRPVVEALAGRKPRALRFLRACLKSEVTVKPGLTRFLPARLCGEFEQCQVEAVRWHGSGDLMAVAQADCFLVVPPDRERIAAGEIVSVLLKN